MFSHGQDNTTIIKKYNLSKEYKSYLKADSFLELIEKKEKYESEKQNKISIEFLNWKTQECIIEETIYNYNKHEGEIPPHIYQVITYHYINQHLYSKKIEYPEEWTKGSIRIDFYKSKNIKAIEDPNLGLELFWDIDGLPTKKDNISNLEFNSNTITTYEDFGYKIPVIDIRKIKMSAEKLKEIKTFIRVKIKAPYFTKSFYEFSVSDWEKFNAIRDYLKKELSCNLYKEKDIYLVGQSENILELIYEDGSHLDLLIGNDPSLSFTQWVGTAHIGYYANGSVAYICHKAGENPIGIDAKYNPDGSIIKEINLANEFTLTLASIYEIVKHHAKYKDRISFDKNNVVRYLDTNYGKTWKVLYNDSYIISTIFIDDASGKIYDEPFKEFTQEEYTKQFGNADVSTIEKQENIKVLINKYTTCP